MASGTDLSHSILHGSTEVVESPCTICQTQGKTEIESTSYCGDCVSYMCQSCTTSHGSFPAMASHAVVDVSKAPPARPLKAPLPTVYCEDHGARLIDRYCPKHDEVGCETCVKLRHRQCTDVKSIRTFVNGMHKSSDLQMAKTSVDKIINDLNHRKTSRQEMYKQLYLAETKSKQEVRKETKRLHDYIDNIASVEYAKIESEFQPKKTALQEDAKVILAHITAIEAVKTNINDHQDGNDSNTFIFVKQVQKHERDAKQVFLDTSSHTIMTVPKYRVTSGIESALKNVDTLGEFTN